MLALPAVPCFLRVQAVQSAADVVITRAANKNIAKVVTNNVARRSWRGLRNLRGRKVVRPIRATGVDSLIRSAERMHRYTRPAALQPRDD